MIDTLPLSIAGRREIAEAILHKIIRAHGMAMSHLTSKCRWKEYVAARIEAAQKLNAMGFNRDEIGGFLARDPSTINYYLMTPEERHQSNQRAG